MGSNRSLCLPPIEIIQLPLLPVVHIHIPTHTKLKKKKIGVLGTQLRMGKKIFFQFPLKCMRNAESQILPFSLHLPQIYEKTMSTLTLIEYRVTWMNGY